jgi:hypothetical protein
MEGVVGSRWERVAGGSVWDRQRVGWEQVTEGGRWERVGLGGSRWERVGNGVSRL